MVYLRTDTVKFSYCEKAIQFEKKNRLFLNYLVTSKQSGIFFQIFVVFSEYLMFNCVFRTAYLMYKYLL